MKIHLFVRALIVSLPFLLSACSKQEEPAAPVAQKPAAPPAPPAPVAETPKAPSDAIAEAKPAAAAAANEATKAGDTVKSTESGASAQVGAWFDKIKGLINEKKYNEALTALSQPPPVNLTAEQQSLVEQLKTQVQNAVAKQSTDEGLKAVGGLLNKK